MSHLTKKKFDRPLNPTNYSQKWVAVAVSTDSKKKSLNCSVCLAKFERITPEWFNHRTIVFYFTLSSLKSNLSRPCLAYGSHKLACLNYVGCYCVRERGRKAAMFTVSTHGIRPQCSCCIKREGGDERCQCPLSDRCTSPLNNRKWETVGGGKWHSKAIFSSVVRLLQVLAIEAEFNVASWTSQITTFDWLVLNTGKREEWLKFCEECCSPYSVACLYTDTCPWDRKKEKVSEQMTEGCLYIHMHLPNWETKKRRSKSGLTAVDNGSADATTAEKRDPRCQIYEGDKAHISACLYSENCCCILSDCLVRNRGVSCRKSSC